MLKPEAELGLVCGIDEAGSGPLAPGTKLKGFLL